MTGINFHIPVLLNEALEGLAIEAGKKYIDATIGGGGHGIEIVRLGGILLGIDTDIESVEFTRQKFKSQIPNFKESHNWKIVQGNFQDIEKIAKENGFGEVNGIIFDLGVSSHQLDSTERGFSYRFPGSELDLRLDQNSGEKAALLVNRLSEDELYEIFAKFGEEKRARTIAHALVRARRIAPVTKVSELVGIVSGEIPGDEKNATLSRIFQALRISVNDELTALESGLKGAEKILNRGGRLVVISFHSLEDRMVKLFMSSGRWKIITKKPLTPGFEELKSNHRSRSAKLRIGEKL